MRLWDYIKDKLFSLLLLCISIVLSYTLLYHLGIRTLFIIFVESIFTTAFLTHLIWDYLRRRKFYNQLIGTLDKLDQKTLLAEIASQKAYFIDGEILSDIIRQSDKYMNDRIAEMELTNREYREYIEMWVHEIKTPITSAHLMVDNDKNVTTLHIDDELQKIDRFVEQALFYARSTALEKDFKVESITLKELCTAAIKTYSRPIIQASGRFEFVGLESSVSADKKWCVFIIGQLLANAVKYRKSQLMISFTEKKYENGTCLMVSDNGIGIPANDLTRVFDKGFTGSNGRRYGKSTGIGLYLCKKLCRKMNMEISIESVENVGTTVNIYFPKNELLPLD